MFIKLLIILCILKSCSCLFDTQQRYLYLKQQTPYFSSKYLCSVEYTTPTLRLYKNITKEK